MYRVEVEVLLWGIDGTMALSRVLRLPFAPFPGLELYGLTPQAQRPELVASVGWDISESGFRIELEEYQALLGESLSELIDSFGPGWRLHEPGCEPVAGC